MKLQSFINAMLYSFPSIFSSLQVVNCILLLESSTNAMRNFAVVILVMVAVAGAVPYADNVSNVF